MPPPDDQTPPPDPAPTPSAIDQAGRYTIAAAVASALIANQGVAPAACHEPDECLARAVKAQTDAIVAALNA